ncbi:uncharacterized protein LOC117179832 [Belonocnema kinseyi]|uniref:uncharacterized protein LOC117179832 n=1 Tax=Belonocnema kinseyi TaxID=2817044 RepID=UPI00143CDA18|nr:uncharacterized protein LOC117179832 [Belonocnema kinseyi]
MPSVLIDRKPIPIPKGVFLADPAIHQPFEVDSILGANYFYQFLCPVQIPIANHEAMLQETELVWVVAGCFHQTRVRQGKSSEEEACKLRYSKNTTYESSSRYTVQLPLNEHKKKMSESRRTVFNQFLSLKSKLAKYSDLKTQYSDWIQGYIKAGYMSLNTENKSSQTGFYLPHHAVRKENCVTTKTRVVFEGSANSSTDIYLNDTLMVGPTIEADLFTPFT